MQKTLNKKTYFYASTLRNKETNRESLIFHWQNGMWWHRAGGGPNKVNFVLEELVKRHGKEEGISIYQKFNEALLAISKNKNEKWDFPRACLVLFSKNDGNKNWERQQDVVSPSEDLHEGESRPSEIGEGKKETTSSTER